jgi:hypothetical protein
MRGKIVAALIIGVLLAVWVAAILYGFGFIKLD